MGILLLSDAPAGHHGSCLHKNKYPVQLRWWIELPWFLTGTSHFKTRLQWIMVVVFIILDCKFVLMNTTTMIHCRHISLQDTPVRNHGSCIHQNKFTVQTWMMNTTTLIHCRHISLQDTHIGNHSSCIHQNECTAQDGLKQLPWLIIRRPDGFVEGFSHLKGEFHGSTQA